MPRAVLPSLPWRFLSGLARTGTNTGTPDQKTQRRPVVDVLPSRRSLRRSAGGIAPKTENPAHSHPNGCCAGGRWTINMGGSCFLSFGFNLFCPPIGSFGVLGFADAMSACRACRWPRGPVERLSDSGSGERIHKLAMCPHRHRTTARGECRLAPAFLN